MNIMNELEEGNAEIKSELKELRKKLYTYHNKLLEIERQSRLSKEEYDGFYNNKRQRMENGGESSKIVAFEEPNSPLRNVYILEMIANYLPSQDLKNARQVCRVWKKEMSRCLATRRTLIVTESDCPEATTIAKNAAKSSLVAIGSICFFDISTSTPLFQNLMTAFGCTLSGLKLEECKSSCEDLALILAKKCPNLESFSYKDRAQAESQRSSTFINIKNRLGGSSLNLPDLKRLFWDEEFGRVELEQIIESCPNLVELVYKNTAIPSPPSYRNLRWDTLRTLRLSPRDELRDEYILSLTSLKLNLQRLTMFGVTPTISAKVRMLNLRKFLKSISSTLEDLELFQHHSIGSRYNPTHESPFPVSLPKLKRLNIDFSILKTLKTLSYLPELQFFECKAKSFEDWKDLGKKGYPEKNPTLELLSLGAIKSLVRFTNCFQACTNLEVYPEYIDDNAMRGIIKGFPQLQQFKIARLTCNSKLPLLTDSGLTGFSLTSCKAGLKSLQKFDSSNKKKFPCIFDLKELIRLEILAEESLLTDLSVIYGVAMCSKIAILGLPKGNATCDYTDLSLNAIKDNLKLTLLDLPFSKKFSKACVTDLKDSHKDMILQSGILQIFKS